MKKSAFIVLIAFSLLAVNSQKGVAQSQQGIVTIDAGVGYSIAFALIKEGGKNKYGPGGTATIDKTVIPVFNAAVDYRVIKFFSIGVAGSYQSAVLNWNNYTNTVTGQTIDFSENISRLSFGLRPLFHFGNNQFDFYMGLRLGVIVYSDNNNSNDPNFTNSLSNGTLPFIEAVFGFNLYLNDFIGLQSEVCIGAPYFMEGGVVFRLHNKNTNKSKDN